MENKISKGLLDVSQAELRELFKPQGDPGGLMKFLLIIVGLLLTPITLLGALLFYRRAYVRFMEPENQSPRLHRLSPIVKVGMLIGGVLIWAVLYIGVQILVRLILWVGGETVRENPNGVLIFLGANILLTTIVFFWFNRWRRGIFKYMSEKQRHGSARFANEKELEPYRKPRGFYIGKGTFYAKATHILTVGGTRAGKGVHLILMNLLMPWQFKGSWVVLDPKAENGSISGRIQRFFGRKVVYLNPFNLLSLVSTGYNPLSILKSGISLTDDVRMFAECIVPQAKGENKHFQDRARSFVSTLLLHLMTAAPKEDRHLGTLWSWLRFNPEKWMDLLAEMSINDDPIVGDIVVAGANEIISMMKYSDKEYGAVMSNACEATGFIQSPALRQSLKGGEGFSADDLATGKTTVYLCVPFDMLGAYSAWSRLVVTSLMRSVIRNPQHKQTCFLIEEANAFGYHSEIETAMSGYAGMGVRIWNIFQDLSQIKSIYGENKWQTFIQNSSVRHFFNISDNFSAEYLEKMCGSTSIPTYDDKGNLNGATARPLITADEIRRESGDTIFTLIDQLPIAQIPKFPYYLTDLPCDPNPYFKPEPEEEPEIPGEHEMNAIREKLKSPEFSTMAS